MNPHFTTTSRDAWDTMLSLIRSARHSIDLEQYIFENDEVGHRFLKAIIERAQAGVKVRIILDCVGSYYFYASLIPHELRKLGIHISFFNEVRPWRIDKFFSFYFRTHRKILIVDAAQAVIGGVGIRSDMRDWRDTCVRVEGPVVKEIIRAFNEMWSLSANKNIFGRLKKVRAYERKNTFVTNAPYPSRRLIYRACLKQFSKAKKSIYITTPYFVPNQRMVRKLKRAARRGVDVRILVPEKNDVSIVYRATHSFFDELLSAGVKIFEYEQNFLHTKTILVDNAWSLVGSFNFDNLSFFYNHECAIITTAPSYAEVLRAHFIHDLSYAHEVRLVAWRRRPFLWKLHEWLVKPIRRFL